MKVKVGVMGSAGGELPAKALEKSYLLGRAIAEADCVVVVTHHDAFDWRRIGDQAKLIVDTRHVVGSAARSRVVTL